MIQQLMGKIWGKKLVDHTYDLVRNLPEDAQERICECVLDLYVVERKSDEGRLGLNANQPTCPDS